MDLENFAEKVKNLIQTQVDGIQDIRIEYQNHVNSKNLGLTIIQNTNISPIIYLEPYFDDWSAGKPIDDIVKDIIETTFSFAPSTDFDTSFVYDYSRVKEHIVMFLINTELNQEYMDGCPHKDIEDLSIIYKIQLHTPEIGVGYICVNNELMKEWGVTKEEIHQIALENSITEQRYQVIKYKDIRQFFLPFDFGLKELTLESKSPVYSVSNSDFNQGAAALLYSNALSEISEKMDDNLYIVPISIHQILIVSGSENKEQWKNVLECINIINPNEAFLSNNLYLYDRKSHEITII